jgi:putative FmdB family regulatory protein
MPIFDYKCNDCNVKFEAFITSSEVKDPDFKVVCPKCASETVEKVVARSNFKLIGTGWYETDFKTKPSLKEE